MALTDEEKVGIIRVLIPDTDAVFGAAEDEYLFEDADLTKFLVAAGGNAVRAAGFAMIAVGNSEALIGKVIKTQDLMTDASKLQDKWRASGEAMLQRADKEEDREDMGYFEIVDFQEGWRAERPELTEWGFSWA